MDKKTYARPKILLIDIDPNVQTALSDAGFDVRSGSLGSRYATKPGNHYIPIAQDAHLPELDEQDIVIVDLTDPPLANAGTTCEWIDNRSQFAANCSSGIVDNRPAAVASQKTSFERIEQHGGLFVIFASPNSAAETVLAYNRSGYGVSTVEKNFSKWGMLPLLSPVHFTTHAVSGKEINLEKDSAGFGDLIARHLDGSSYTCSLHPVTTTDGYDGKVTMISNRGPDTWEILAKNKYGDVVGAAFHPTNGGSGWVVILPQIADKSTFLLELIRDLLPGLAPKLFPESENMTWTQSDIYQPPKVVELQNNILSINEEAQKKIESLSKEIDEERAKNAHHLEILTETDRKLVISIKRSLEEIGFAKVVDCDDKEEKTDATLDEDLQVHDQDMTVLVEVKGIGGLPKDNDILQVTKHVPNRMREWETYKVKGLVIVNQQRSLPALERQNDEIVRADLLSSAEEQHLGILTTLDLYKIVRSYNRNSWKHEDIREIFLKSGRLQPIPTHYQLVGIIDNFFADINVATIAITESGLSEGDIVAVDSPLEFLESSVVSMEIDKVRVVSANIGQTVAFKLDNENIKPKKGSRLYRIDRST